MLQVLSFRGSGDGRGYSAERDFVYNVAKMASGEIITDYVGLRSSRAVTHTVLAGVTALITYLPVANFLNSAVCRQ